MMHGFDEHIVGHLMRSVVTGAIAGFLFMASILTLDVAGIGTMLSTASAKTLMSAIVLGGSATKGAAFGFAFAVATLGWKQRAPRPALSPALATKSA